MKSPLVFCLLLLVAGSVAASSLARAEEPPTRMQARIVQPSDQNVPLAPQLTPEERALQAVQEEARVAVAELAKSMAGLPDGPALRALERKVEQTKRDYRVQFLQVKADFARKRGDLAAMHQAEDLIDRILHPRPATPASAVQRQAPEKGGRP